ncbi:MAG: ABC transporter ATP-binding protein [Spirochaetaceae bacterium]|jgi:simple sugar transport system ATP-binding protein|nr:ABC transporter ATP-binding protein [Spirochaetaceae bacterium]
MEIEFAASLRNISKLYNETGRWANRGVSLDLKKAEILCLAGENGAGKSTLMKILYGLVIPTEGEILINEKPVKIHSPLDAKRLGIGMVHQHFMLFPELTVAENVVMGVEPKRAGVFYNFAKARASVTEVIKRHGFSVEAASPVASLTVGQMQQVEILKLLYRDVDIFILDEPTAVLTDQEITSLFNTFRILADAGKSLVLITHKINEIKRISSRTAIMRKGELIALLDTGQTDEREISRLMIGSETEFLPQWEGGRREGWKGGGTSEPVLAFENATVLRKGQKRPVLDKIDFAVHEGEILGFAGVGGNGLGTLEAVLGGFLPVSAGRILHRGRDISAFKTRSLRKQGLAYVPGDRLGVGSAPDATVLEAMIINKRPVFFRRGFLDKKAADAFTGELIKSYGISGSSGDPVRSLSGGNIQKLILAREIEQYRDYIVFSEPTRGLDVLASRYVYEQMELLRNKKAAILLISSNLDEILSNADRILVFYRGTIAAEINNPLLHGSGEDADTRARLKEAIGEYMLGLKHRDTALTEDGLHV